MPKQSPKKHNKSGKEKLSLMDHAPSKIHIWFREVKRKSISVEGLIKNSPCSQYPTKDGRLTEGQDKIAYAYQIVAYEKFGKEKIQHVLSSKRSEDLTISHLCGTRNCTNPAHLILETKRTNDERTHCHWCLRNADRNGRIAKFFESQACPHSPCCLSVDNH